jgi:hypothetical protein
MKNREKFAEQIIDIALKRCGIAVNLTSGELCACGNTRCSECLFCERNKDCEVLLKEWAEKEYEEPPVDWSKIPVDAPILVRDCEEEVWEKRHFAKYENGIVYTWRSGKTSWSTYNGSMTGWKMAKLAEEVES